MQHGRATTRVVAQFEHGFPAHYSRDVLITPAEGEVFISAQLSTEGRFRKVLTMDLVYSEYIGLWSSPSERFGYQ